MSQRDILVLRLDAPLMSFGGIVVGERGVTEEFPTRSMLTGLLGNALGYDHGDGGRLQRLQDRLRHAARQDRPGRLLVDFQTVDLSQLFLSEGWTTRGVAAGRAGGSAATGTHIRRRQYRADAVYTAAILLEPEAEEPDLEHCASALLEPERPLFLGRKPCIPALPLVLGVVRAASLYEALCRATLSPRSTDGPWAASWPEALEPAPAPEVRRLVPLYDQRDWTNQIHTGRRFVWESLIQAEDLEATDG